MNLLDLIKEAGFDPEKKGVANEYGCACPFCGGEDRFIIWPDSRDENGIYSGGRFWCRKMCRKAGNAINFLRDFYGMSYLDACTKLKLEPKERSLPMRRPRQEYKPRIVRDPSDLWQEKATAFINWAHDKLLGNQQALALIETRGFSLESIIRFKLGFNSTKIERERTIWGLSEVDRIGSKILKLHEGLIIPVFSNEKVIKIKVRRTNYEKEKVEYDKEVTAGKKPQYKPAKYLSISGGRSSPAIYGNTSLPVAFVQESEFDPLLIQQECGDLCFSVALGGASNPIDYDTHQILKRTPTVFFCPDFDESGIDSLIILKRKIPSLIELITPFEKSPGDAYIAGLNLREWIKEAIEDAPKNQ